MISDLYLWKERININIKIRSGAKDCLKFKRFKSKEGGFEEWIENPSEIFEFPLEDIAWQTLRKELQSETQQLPATIPEPITRAKTIRYLQKTGYEIWEICKIRESRLLKVSDGKMTVEWCCITNPQSIISLGLENHADNRTSHNKNKITNLKEATEILELQKQPLNVMNYLEALDYWANGQHL